MGTPTEETWQDINELQEFKATFPQWKCNAYENLKKMSYNMDEQALDLMFKMVQLEPSKRISAKEALEHPYFEGIKGIRT